MDNRIVPYVEEPLSPREVPLGAAGQENDTMEGVLYTHYSEQVRPYLELIDSFRIMGIDNELSLPAIAVIGDQSSGKSSVLEALSGVALPRGSGIVTRCPLMLKLRRVMRFSEWTGIISYKGITKEIEHPSRVGYYVSNAQDELAGKGVGISKDLISLEIRSPDVCDLTLIDLPGIARVPLKGQPKDIGDQIKNLLHSFIEKEETINLVVAACNTDIATTEALRMAQELDPEGKRTLAVLTKPDLVDSGTEKNILDIVDNHVIPLRKGYIIVKCRGQQQIEDGISLTEATRLEKEFFRQHTYFRHLIDERKATTQCLTVRLTEDLVGCIKNFLPTLSEEIKKKLDSFRKLLSQYPVGPPTDALKRKRFLIEILIQFNDKIKQLSEGKAVNDENLLGLLREQCENWKNELENSRTLFYAEIQNVVKEYNLRHRGKELPGFSDYEVFQQVTQKAVGRLKCHAEQTLRNIREKVEKQFNYVTKSCFSNFPFLEFTTMNRINRIQIKQETKMMKRITEQFEMENLIYTQDSIFYKCLQTIKSTDVLRPPSPRPNDVCIDENQRTTPQVSSSKKRAKSPPRTPQIAKRARQKASSSDQATEEQDLPSMTDMDANPDTLQAAPNLKGGYSTMNSAYETMGNYPLLLHAYYEIMIQRQADQIPMQIQYFLLNKAAEMLRTEMLSLIEGEDVEKFLTEVSDSSSRRTDLQGRIQRLTKAQEKLSHFL